jgi:hypothetical protein
MSVPPGGSLAVAGSGNRNVRLIAGAILGLGVCACACVATLGGLFVLQGVLSGVRTSPEFTLYVQNQDCSRKQPSLPLKGFAILYPTNFEVTTCTDDAYYVVFTRYKDANKKVLGERYGLMSVSVNPPFQRNYPTVVDLFFAEMEAHATIVTKEPLAYKGGQAKRMDLYSVTSAVRVIVIPNEPTSCAFLLVWEKRLDNPTDNSFTEADRRAFKTMLDSLDFTQLRAAPGTP